MTGQNLGAGSSVAIGTLVPDTGNQLNGLFLPGGDIPKATYESPFLSFGPRFGAAYDLSGSQTLVLRGGLGLFYDRPFTTALSGGVNNPPTSAIVTAQYAQLQSLGGAGLSISWRAGTDRRSPSTRSCRRRRSGTSALQAALPWATSVDVSYVGSYGYDLLQQVNINAIDFGAAFLPQNQDPTQTSTTPGAAVVSNNQMRAHPRLRQHQPVLESRLARPIHSLQLSFQRRFQNGVSFGFNDTIGLSDRQQAALRLQHSADGSYSIRADQADADELLGQQQSGASTSCAPTSSGTCPISEHPVGHGRRRLSPERLADLGDLVGRAARRERHGGQLARAERRLHRRLSAITNGGGNQNLTGSPDYGARVYVVGDPGNGCSDDPLRQFNTAAFTGPAVGSVGLESGNDYLTACFISALDLAIRRNIRLGGSRVIELRVDMFNAFNQAGITGRNTTMNLTSPSDPTTITNLPFNPDGTVIDARSRPRGAGFGVATGYQDPRTVQLQIRFSF